MSNELLFNGMKGERHLLPGNEAIVRGALEAGVHVITCYPGTPSSEVPDAFYRRHYARFASLPCFKPATVQEAKDMTRTWPSAWPVSCSSLSCCATTMRINHMCGPVDFDDLPHISSIVKFQREPARLCPCRTWPASAIWPLRPLWKKPGSLPKLAPLPEPVRVAHNAAQASWQAACPAIIWRTPWSLAVGKRELTFLNWASLGPCPRKLLVPC